MSDFSSEELFDAIDASLRRLFQHAGVESAPVPTVELVERVFGYTIEYVEPEEEDEYTGQPRPRRRRPREILFPPTLSETGQQLLAARAIATELVPEILGKLGVTVGTETKAARTQFVNLITPRLLMPTRWFDMAARRASLDILRIKETFPNVTMEMIGLRLLDLEDPSVIAIVDDGVVSIRRSNMMSVNKLLSPAEQKCVDDVTEKEEPASVRREGWSAWGWPVSGSQFRRIIVRALPDEL